MPLTRLTQPMFRYGEKDFDQDYLTWGLHEAETQEQEAQSLLKIMGDGELANPDLAGGIGRHAVKLRPCRARRHRRRSLRDVPR